jgi:alpha-beta hydrolase superfamily lysophospholipase
VAGESLGGAVAIEAFASDRPPAADRLILLAPAVWGWSRQPVTYSAALWLADHLAPGWVLTPPRWLTSKIYPTDNVPEMIAMSRDPLMEWGARTDALYGLVATMQNAWRETGAIRVPTLYLYGAHDEVIPKRPSFEAAARLPAGDRTAYYAKGWHLLLRDLQAKNVWADSAAFVLDPAAPPPSGAPPIPPPAAAEARKAPPPGL